MTLTPERERDDPAALTASLLDAEAERQAESTTGKSEIVLPDDLLPGVGGESVGLRQALRRGGLSTVTVLTLLNFFDGFDRQAFAVLAPDIQRTLGLSDGGLGAVAGLGALVFTLSAIPLGTLADRSRRAPIAAVAGLIAGIFGLLTGAVQTIWQLVVVRLAIGTGQASTLSLHNSMLSDAYPIEARGSILGLHNTAGPAARLIAPILAGGIAALVGGAAGWRWAFILPAVGVIVVALFAFGLREPVRGGEERRVLRERQAQLLQQDAASGRPDEADVDLPVEDPADELRIPLDAGVQRLLKIQTLYYLLVGIGVLGFSIVGVPVFFNVLLEEVYGLGPFERGLVGSINDIGALIGVPLGGIIGQRLFRSSPPKAILLVAASVAAYGVTLAISLLFTSLPLLIFSLTVATVFAGLGLVPVYAFVAAVVPFRLRGLGFALIGVFTTLVGGLLGSILIGNISDARGPRFALLSTVPAASLVAAGLIAYGARFVRRDISLVVEELREEQEERDRVLSTGDTGSLLQVRNLDFSYGSVQVLFDVAVEVRRGEVLALLGTNGAGKSTLLRAITGLQLPDRGVVRFEGRTVTYLDAETRVGMGIVQVPGGKAIFPGMTVTENLLAGAHQFIWDRDTVRARVEDVLELFPRLRERLDQPAGTLSGGEQQQLAIAKALLLDPTLLCIDELSLGLAPVVVQDILATVEKLKERGVTMVIVEQSVNVALSIADRAVFMEKGQVRFEGPARDLLERDDLVRAVFLGGEGG